MSRRAGIAARSATIALVCCVASCGGSAPDADGAAPGSAEAVRHARTCCDCVNGIWSSDEDCALARDQQATFRACADGSGFEHASRVADAIVRDPYRFFRRPPGEGERIVAVCAQLAAEHPEDAVVALSLGLFQYYLEDQDGALATLSEVVERDDLLEHPHREQEAFEHQGLLYLALGDHPRAEAALQRNVEYWERMPVEAARYRGCPFQRLGELYDDTGRGELAAEFHRRAASVDLHDPLRYLDGALAHFVAGHHMESLASLETLDELLASRPSAGVATAESVATLRARAGTLRGYVALLEGRPGDAATAFDDVLAARPDEAGARVGRAHLALIAQDLAAAEENLRGDVPDDDDAYSVVVREMAWLGRAQLETARGQPLAALPHYDRILDADPDAVHGLVGKAAALLALGRDGEADALVARALAHDPDNVYARTEAGILAYNRGDLERAEELFQAAADQGAGRATCPHEGLGLVYLRMGRTDDARAHFQTAIEIDPDVDYKKYNGLARIHIEAGELDRATELLEKSRDNHPHDDEAAALLAEIERLHGERARRGTP